jgi:hypothetical protein
MPRTRREIVYGEPTEPVGPTMAKLGTLAPEWPPLKLARPCLRCGSAIFSLGIYCTQCGERA